MNVCALHVFACDFVNFVCTQILKELEGLHLSAAEQLEGLYEARLALEKERLRQLAAAKDDIELALKVGSHHASHQDSTVTVICNPECRLCTLCRRLACAQ